MGDAFSSCTGGDKDQNQKFERDGENSLAGGPKMNRGCTDIMCIPLFAFAQLVFIGVTVMGMADGNPQKLYRPRDLSGAYCGVAENWNNGLDLTDQTKLTYTMNITSMVDPVMKQTICSTQASRVMLQILPTQALKDEYLCDCCISPCKKCDGALEFGGQIADATSLASTVTARMAELTDPAKAKDLLTPGGANGMAFSSESFWREMTKYFNQVCLPQCVANSSSTRAYVYTPPADSEYYQWWTTLLNATGSGDDLQSLKDVVSSAFTFTALSEDVCPYDPSWCVPFPGIQLSEMTAGSDYCTFQIASDVMGALGDTAANAFESLGMEAFKGAATESFGSWVGDFQASLDSFIITAVLSFVIGVVFLVLLRFFIGICVWLAVVSTIFMFFVFGYFLFVRSHQCEGASLLDTGHQVSVAIVVAAKTSVADTLSGTDAPSEAMTGDGVDYRGRQMYTRYGKKCLVWETQDVMPWYRAENYTVLSPANTTKSFCRNPYQATDDNKAKTIWCITSDPDVAWEECLPIGVIQPECTQGYAITGQSMRDALWYSSFVVWALGGVWVIVIICFVNRIRLAIALNKVAASYLATNPSTVLIPVVQAFVAILWCLCWFYSASYLLSQVPDNYTPKGYYATYAEAWGTESPCSIYEFGDKCEATPGACTDKWPTGGVFKDSTCDMSSGSPKCWRCSPPRFALDWRFAVSFFVFLWNNAFNIALGQILIAMAVSYWFFSTDKMKDFVVVKGVKTIFRYHVGTVAFGSFIVALVEFIRYLMKYFEKQAAAQKNRVMVLVLKCLQCCIWCFEKCIKFLNKNAYIQTSLMGTNFCVSAKKAFFLILRNALRFATVAVLGNAIRCIGFLCIMSSTGCVGYLLLREMHPDVSPFMPLVMMLICGYVVANLFMNVFGLAVDTCLQCFLVVEEMGLEEFGGCVPQDLSNFVNSQVSPQDKPAEGK